MDSKGLSFIHGRLEPDSMHFFLDDSACHEIGVVVETFKNNETHFELVPGRFLTYVVEPYDLDLIISLKYCIKKPYMKGLP